MDDETFGSLIILFTVLGIVGLIFFFGSDGNYRGYNMTYYEPPAPAEQCEIDCGWDVTYHNSFPSSWRFGDECWCNGSRIW